MELNFRNMPWPVIIFLLLTFTPIGILLLWLKLGSDRKAPLRSSNIFLYIGYALMFIGAVNLLSAMGSVRFFSRMMAAIFYLAAGYALTKVAKKMKVRGETYRRYISIVANQHVTDIDSVAAAMGVSYADAIEDLQKMIDMGYFGQAHLDLSGRRIVLPARSPATFAPSGAVAAAAAPSPSVRVVSCRNCGANNTVMGGASECEYCGSPLS